MGFPVSPIVANLYTDHFEQKALSIATHPHSYGSYVDDTFVIQKEENKQNFLQHINSVDPAIQFTVENNKEDGAIPFLDATVKPENDGNCPLLYMGNLHTQTNTYSETATIISQLNTVSLVPSPLGPKQSVPILSSSKKKWSI